MKRGSYRDGQKAALGDIVRVWTDAPGCTEYGVGHVDVVVNVDAYGDPVLAKARAEDYGYNGERFELIARAGEPVIFQPGDVVECVRNNTTDSCFTVGRRYTVSAAYARGKGTVEDDLGRHRYCDRAALNVYRSFKLVHRPDPVKAAEPLTFTPPAELGGPTFAIGERLQHTGEESERWKRDDVWVIEDDTYGLTIRRESDGKKLRSIGRYAWRIADPLPAEPRVGDRVRVTYEVDVRGDHRPGPGTHDLEGLGHLRDSWNAKVEVIAVRPLAVGDRVRNPSFSRQAEILCIDGDAAFIRVDYEAGSRRFVMPVAKLERVS